MNNDMIPASVAVLMMLEPDATTGLLELFALALAQRLQIGMELAQAGSGAAIDANALSNSRVLAPLGGVWVRPPQSGGVLTDPFQPKQFIPGVTEASDAK
jgi:hypothetical protein